MIFLNHQLYTETGAPDYYMTWYILLVVVCHVRDIFIVSVQSVVDHQYVNYNKVV